MSDIAEMKAEAEINQRFRAAIDGTVSALFEALYRSGNADNRARLFLIRDDDEMKKHVAAAIVDHLEPPVPDGDARGFAAVMVLFSIKELTQEPAWSEFIARVQYVH